MGPRRVFRRHVPPSRGTPPCEPSLQHTRTQLVLHLKTQILSLYTYTYIYFFDSGHSTVTSRTLCSFYSVS